MKWSKIWHYQHYVYFVRFCNEASQFFIRAWYWPGLPTGALLNDRINIHV